MRLTIIVGQTKTFRRAIYSSKANGISTISNGTKEQICLLRAVNLIHLYPRLSFGKKNCLVWKHEVKSQLRIHPSKKSKKQAKIVCSDCTARHTRVENCYASQSRGNADAQAQALIECRTQKTSIVISSRPRWDKDDGQERTTMSAKKIGVLCIECSKGERNKRGHPRSGEEPSSQAAFPHAFSTA